MSRISPVGSSSQASSQGPLSNHSGRNALWESCSALAITPSCTGKPTARPVRTGLWAELRPAVSHDAIRASPLREHQPDQRVKAPSEGSSLVLPQVEGCSRRRSEGFHIEKRFTGPFWTPGVVSFDHTRLPRGLLEKAPSFRVDPHTPPHCSLLGQRESAAETCAPLQDLALPHRVPLVFVFF